MEAAGEAKLGSLLDKIKPPRLEDAGLEDCALPPDSIQEAFLKAATAVGSRVFATSSDNESDGECVNDPWPGNESSGDKLVGGMTEADTKCGELPVAIGDELVVGGREDMPDKVVESEVPDEVEKLQGLKIKEKKIDGEIKRRG